jgi:thymidylate synthase
MIDTQYERLMMKTLSAGRYKEDRTGVGTRSIFGDMLRYDLSAGHIPLITTKRVHFKSVVGELLWFLSGSTNVHDLQQKYGVSIWDEWADPITGDLGPVYGHQWRSWGENDLMAGIDQISNVMETLKTNPNSRRMVVSAWNPADLHAMALEPCHVMFQLYHRMGTLSLAVYQRSCDLFLGVPFNIASYALLLRMFADQAGMHTGDLVWYGGDIHLYVNHIDAAHKQLARPAYEFPRMVWADTPKPADIFSYTPDLFTLEGYMHHPGISVPVAV